MCYGFQEPKQENKNKNIIETLLKNGKSHLIRITFWKGKEDKK